MRGQALNVQRVFLDWFLLALSRSTLWLSSALWFMSTLWLTSTLRLPRTRTTTDCKYYTVVASSLALR